MDWEFRLAILKVLAFFWTVPQFSAGAVKHTFDDASTYCHSHFGSSLGLPRDNTFSEHTGDSIWLPIKRFTFGEYRWLDDTPVTGDVYDADVDSDCGAVDVRHGKLVAAPCSSNHFFICQHPGKGTSHVNPHLVKIVDGHRYSFHGGVTTWFAAKVKCQAKAAKLAVFHDKNMMREVASWLHHESGFETIRGKKIFFVGFRSTEWAVPDEIPIKVDRWLWGSGQPAPHHDCAVATRSGSTSVWSTEDCDAKHGFVCLKGMPIVRKDEL